MKNEEKLSKKELDFLKNAVLDLEKRVASLERKVSYSIRLQPFGIDPQINMKNVMKE